VREDQGETWVRFGRMISLSLDAVGGPWRLEVRSRDGYHAGSAMVSSVYGVHEQTVRIELMPHGRIVGTVLDRDRQPIPGAKLRLVADAEDAIPGGRRKLVADDEGRFRIDGVAPGSYLLRASSPRHHAAESPVTVQRRLELERDFRLDPLTIAGDVRGEIRSVSGEFRGLVFAWIEDPGQEGLREADVRWSRRGEEWVGSFAFVDLPPGEHTVYFQTSGNNRLEPSELQVSPPATGLSVLCIDAREPEPVAFHVYDAATGEEFPLFQVSFWSPGSFVTHPAATQRTPMRHIGGSAEFEWLVFVGGYVPCHGDETAFQPGEAGDGKPARSVEVPLVRGWGSRFHVVGPDGEALAGARILLDGAEAGTTDSEGWVLASAPSEPDAIEVLYRDWTMSGGDVDPLSGKVASRVLGVRVELAPPE
jgi:hypothetical protein